MNVIGFSGWETLCQDPITNRLQTSTKRLHTDAVWVTKYFPDSRRLKALAFLLDRKCLQNRNMDIAGTLCEHVTEQVQLIHFSDNLLNLFPIDPAITGIEAASYMGLSLTDSVGNILGHLGIMETRPMPAEPLVQNFFVFLHQEQAPNSAP